MPIQACEDGGKPGFRWGPKGICHTYEPEDVQGKAAAIRAAAHDAVAEVGPKPVQGLMIVE